MKATTTAAHADYSVFIISVFKLFGNDSVDRLVFFFAESTRNCYQTSVVPDLNNSSQYCKGQSLLRLLQLFMKQSQFNTQPLQLDIFFPKEVNDIFQSTLCRVNIHIHHNLSKSNLDRWDKLFKSGL